MKKSDFMRGLEEALNKISEEERREILYDYEEHFTIGREKGKTEEEICLELGEPKEIANNYLLNYKNESTAYGIEKEIQRGNSSSQWFKKHKLFIGSSIAAAALIFFIAGHALMPGHNNYKMGTNEYGVNTGGIKIDDSGIHGAGISIDNNGIKVPGVSVDNGGVNVPGISVDNNGVKMPGISIDDNGIKLPGVTIDDKGIKVDLPNINIDVKK